MHTYDTIAVLVDYRNGLSVEEICAKHDVGVSSLYYTIKRAGVEKRGSFKYLCNDFLFSEETEAGKYWLGFCAADGHACLKTNELQVQLAKKDRDQLVKLQTALRTEHPIYDYWNRTFPKSSLNVTSTRLMADLLAVDGGTFDSCPTPLQRHLVRGLFDGDGSISLNGKSVRFVGDQDVLEAVQRIVIDQASCTPGGFRQLPGISEWALQGVNNVKKFGDWLYDGATIFMPRKRERF